MLHSYASAVIMSAVYDYETIPNDDPLVLAAERAIEVFVKVAGPSTAAILEAFPFRQLRFPRLALASCSQ